MPHALALGLTLLALWLLLSGFFKPLLLSLGVLSVALVVLLARRMDRIDGAPLGVPLRWERVPGYAWWLGVEIVKSNLDVLRRILHPDMPISPTVLRVPAPQTSDLGRVIYSNSITLTPGTVSIDVGDDWIEVHALTREGAEALAGGEMGERVAALELPPEGGER